MKVVTWNVNSVRVRLERLLALLDRHAPDVVCLQETKIVDGDFPRAPIEERGYTVALHGQKTYNGVALISRLPLDDIHTGFQEDPLPDQARVIAATVAGVRIYDLYVPNGQAPGTDKYETKLRWLDAFRTHLADRYDPADPLLLVGDFNVAPEDRDVHDPKRWQGKILFTDLERARIQGLCDWGLEDLLRLHHAEPDIHTWWDYRMGAFHRGWGLRIDLALGSKPVAARCTEVTVDRDERKPTGGEGKPSDHAPVITTLS